MSTSILEKILTNVKLVVFDFDGVFTDNRVYVSEDGIESVLCWRGDGIGISKLRDLGIPTWVISTETNIVVGTRCKKLDLNYIQGCDNKLKILNQLVDKYQCTLGDVIYTGNDVNDTECLEAVGVPIVVADSHPDVIHLAKYVTSSFGGRGAVREVCDLVVNYINLNKVKDKK